MKIKKTNKKWVKWVLVGVLALLFCCYLIFLAVGDFAIQHFTDYSEIFTFWNTTTTIGAYEITYGDFFFLAYFITVLSLFNILLYELGKALFEEILQRFRKEKE